MKIGIPQDFHNNGDDGLNIDVALDIRSPVSYASYHNHIPVVSNLTVWNRTEKHVTGVQVVIQGVALRQDFRLRIDGLGPGEKKTFDPIDLPLSHEYLAALNEAESVDLKVTVSSDGSDGDDSATQVLELLAYDQWPGVRSLPELLAAFSTPNDPTIDAVLSKAGRLLARHGGDGTMKGYQAESREDVWYQISGIYSVLAAENLVYAEPPKSFTEDGQKVRLPDRIFSGRVATCLDTTMLFASCLEQAGLHPVVLVKHGHAWIGCWLVPQQLPTAVTDDGQSVRKRVQNGELVVFETTGIASEHPPTLKQASELGMTHLQDDLSFMFALDISRARDEQIRPLPDRWKPPEPAPINNEPIQIEDPPSLPPLVDQEADFVGESRCVPGDGRLKRWKGKLLDLTARNRLLNFKITRTVVPLMVPSPAMVEDGLASGRQWKFRSIYELVGSSDVRSLDLAVARTGINPYESVIAQSINKHELVSSLEPEDLATRLLTIFRTNRTALEEGGANTLFLTLGMLYWKDDARGRVQPAPILLIPVSIARKSTRSGFAISRSDDETVVNPTLLQLLRERFQMNLSGLDELPLDDRGVDVTTILQMVRTAVTDIAHWEVRNEVHLGILSYAKHLMWKDLEQRSADLRQHRVVAQLLMNAETVVENPAVDEILSKRDDIDKRHEPWELYAPLDADSSQLNAISRASTGIDLVIEGPPGTGKSQTITNLIAHFLGSGKSVLFVSEKMAALNVVHERLNRVGLGPFCLELHSAKAKKTDVLDQLKDALNVSCQFSKEEWMNEGKKLSRLRRELNDWVDTLHKKHTNGLTIRGAMGTLTKAYGREPAKLSWENPDVHSVADLEEQRELMRTIAGVLNEISPLTGHPLEGIRHTSWTTAWEDTLREVLDRIGHFTERLIDDVHQLLSTWGIEEPLTASEALDVLGQSLIESRAMPEELLKRVGDEHISQKLQELIDHRERYEDAWNTLGTWFKKDVVVVATPPLKSLWAEAQGSSALGRWSRRRRIMAQLKPYARAPLPEGSLSDVLDALERLQAEVAWFQGADAWASSMMGSALYQGSETDRAKLGEMVQWLEDFEVSIRLCAGPGGTTKDRIEHWLQAGGYEAVRAMEPQITQYQQDRKNFLQAQTTLMELTHAKVLPVDLTDLLETVSRWSSAQAQWRLWCRWMDLRQKASALGLAPLMAQLESGRVKPEELEEQWAYSYQYWWFRASIDREDALRNFTRSEHLRRIEDFQQLDNNFRELTARYLVSKLAARVPQNSHVGAQTQEFKILNHELNKKRAHWPVRKLIGALPTLFPRLKPCLLMSPLSVAQYLDEGAQFDVVIFDEASQIPVWDAVGAIARGKQLIVVGDPKQLPPTSFFETQDQRHEDLDDGQFEDLESILDECLGSALPTLRLEWHYRSRHEGLIAFSNHKYYDSQLVTFPSPVTRDGAVRLEVIEGIYDRGGTRTNRSEALAVVEAIAKHFKEYGENAPTLGVVTFNLAQQQLIEELLDRTMRGAPDLERVIMQSKESLFIKNLENVQGDERDIIFFSVTYGRDSGGRVALNMGPLNKEGGHRRLNVAITRARRGVTIFSTIRAEDIDVARTRARGVLDLRDYLRYAETGFLEGGIQHHQVFSLHPIEDQIATELERRGWLCHRNIGSSEHRIDIGVVDPHDPSRFLLGVESDGVNYLSLPSARDRDRLHQEVMNGLGWNLERVWSLDSVVNPMREVDRLESRLNSLVGSQPLGEEGAVQKLGEGAGIQLEKWRDMGEVGMNVPPKVGKDDTPMARIAELPKTLSTPVRFGAFVAWLKIRDDATEIALTFENIEMIMGQTLPPLARNYRAYWSEGHGESTIGTAIRDAGWRVVALDMESEKVTLVSDHRTVK